MKNRVITISREFGSGGRTVGKRTAERLGIPCYDQTLIEQISRESGLSPEFVREKGEYTTHGGWLASVFADRGPDGSSTQDFLWMVQRKVILKLAEEGPCVIVGRCGDYILREAADCLKVFIHADMEKRAERIVAAYGEREEAPVERLRDKDRRRAAYYRFYTGAEWGDARNYHLSLDSGVFGIDRCVDLIAGLY